MDKKVLVISGSPRKGGNSDILCDEFVRGAVDSGNVAAKVRLQELNIAPCLACYACRGTGKCAHDDDMAELLEKMVQAEVLVLATPVYFYSLCGQMKTMIDRTLPRYTEIRDKDVYFIVTAADEKPYLSARLRLCAALRTACQAQRSKAPSMVLAFIRRARSRPPRP